MHPICRAIGRAAASPGGARQLQLGENGADVGRGAREPELERRGAVGVAPASSQSRLTTSDATVSPTGAVLGVSAAAAI